MRCEECKIRGYAERKPKSWIARLWRWHTGWCPGWKRYQAELARRQQGGGAVDLAVAQERMS